MEQSRVIGGVRTAANRLIALFGCVVAVAVVAGCAPGLPSTHRRPATHEAAPISELQRARNELLRTLAAVEKELQHADDDKAAVLRRLRLKLSVAIADLEQRLAGDDADVEKLLEQASARIEAVRMRRQHERERKDGGSAGSALDLLTQANATERAPARDKGAEGGGATASCSPGDPMCSDLDGFGGEDLDEVDPDTTTNESPDKPEPPAPRPSYGFRRSGDKPAPVAAARVAPRGAPRGVMREIRRHFGRVTRCVPADSRRELLRINMAVNVSSGGHFRSAHATAAKLDAHATSCVEEVFGSIRVPDYKGGARKLHFPLFVQPKR